jgi:hypothetical protein
VDRVPAQVNQDPAGRERKCAAHRREYEDRHGYSGSDGAAKALSEPIAGKNTTQGDHSAINA